MTDDLRHRIARALADHEQQDLALDADRYPPERWLCCADAVIAELAAGSEPACSECGGRPKRGLIQSEDGQSWQCEGCYAELSRGLMTDGAET